MVDIVSPIRKCSRVGCQSPAVATMTYGYKEATAVIGPLAPVPQQGALDLCKEHANSVTAPVGWQMVRLVTEFEEAPPSPDDLLALADAIREASKRDVPPPQPAQREVRRSAADINGRSGAPARPAHPRFTVIEGGEESADS